MNKKFLRAGMIFASLLAVLSFGACSDDETTPTPAPAPELTSITPDALTWDAEAVDAKTITVAGQNLTNNRITLSALTYFTATLEGTTVTVTPKDVNKSTGALVETLTVSVANGNSLTATLTHSGSVVPVLKALNPDNLTWKAEEVNAQTITVEGDNMDKATITLSALTAYTATLNGTTITVTPKAANELTEPVSEELTVTVEGKSLTATLTQEAKVVVTPDPDPDPEPETKQWVRVSENKTDWSCEYLVVCDTELYVDAPRLWTLSTDVALQNGANDPNLFITVAENVITAAKTNDGADVAIDDLANYVVTVAALGDGKYAIKIGEGKYIKNSSGNHTAGIKAVEESTAVGATSMELQADGSVKIVAENTNLGLGFIGGEKHAFNYLPLDNGKNIGIEISNDRSFVSLYEYVAVK